MGENCACPGSEHEIGCPLFSTFADPEWAARMEAQMPKDLDELARTVSIFKARAVGPTFCDDPPKAWNPRSLLAEDYAPRPGQLTLYWRPFHMRPPARFFIMLDHESSELAETRRSFDAWMARLENEGRTAHG